MIRRFAIYAAPGSGSADGTGALLRERAEQWLGRAVSGHPVAPGIPAGWTRAAIDAITVDARRYGFHATLKAPFRLAEGRTAEELDAAVARFAAARDAAVIPRLSLMRLGGFFALVPGAESKELQALADDVVTGFDGFRAPLTAAEVARRRPESLTPRRRELLSTWGYPYVLEEFKLHLTLTDQLPPQRWPELERTLTDWFAPLLGAAVPVDSVAVFTEAGPGAPFALHSVHPLRPAPAARAAVARTESARTESARTESEGAR
jgi:putative phosphonate metabolism protein